MTNPVNRSPAVNSIREIADAVSDILNKASESCSINKILKIYALLKEEVRRDNTKLVSYKYLTLNRLQFGVSKLLENSVNP